MGGEGPSTVSRILCLNRNWPCWTLLCFLLGSGHLRNTTEHLAVGVLSPGSLRSSWGPRRPLYSAFFYKVREGWFTAIHTTALGLCQFKFFTFFENRILSLSLLKLVIYPFHLKLLIFQVVKDIIISKYVLKFNSLKDLNNATGSISLFSILKNLGAGYHYWSFAQLWGLFD